MKSLTIRMQTFLGSLTKLATVALLAALFSAAPFCTAIAQVAPPLGTTQSFAILGGQTVTNTGPTIIIGDLGVSPGTAVTGFPPGTETGGTTHAADAVALQAQSDTTIVYNNLAGEASTGSLTGMDLGGLTLVPGVYTFSSSAQLTGALTLDGQNNPAAVWVFQIASTLTTASGSSVVLTNGANPCNVFWQVGSSATLGTTTAFVGNIFALTSISLTTGATVAGRALARNGAVTMDSNKVSIAACGGATGTPVPPTLSKAFSPATINAGGTSTLTITLSNPNTTAASLNMPFTDILPSGVLVSGGGSNTCGGALTATAGSSAVTLTGGSIPVNGSCVLTVDVVAASGGNYINSLAVGALVTSNGNNAAPAVATLTVSAPSSVTLGKAFSPATIAAGGTSTLTITLSNASTTAATLNAPLTDTLPSGVVTSGSASTTCGGTASTGASTVTPTPQWSGGGGASSVTLTGGTIPASGSCVLTVGVVAANGGSYINSLAAGALVTSNGTSAAPAVATLTVSSSSIVTPTLGKAFSPATIAAGGTSTLTITLTNANTTPATLNAPFTDTLPSGVVVSGTASTTCAGGTASTVAPAVAAQDRGLPKPQWFGGNGASTVTLTGGTIPANGSCVLTVDVIAANGGSYINSLAAGALATSNGTNAAPAIATLTVTVPSPVTLGKAFNQATINTGGVSVLTITLSNAGATPALLTAPLTDTLPSGVVASGNASSTCGGTASTGASTATPAPQWINAASSVTLMGGTIPAGSSCTVTVSVTAPVAGSYFNSLPAGALQTDLGNNAAPAVATLTANPTTKADFSLAMVTPGTVQITRGVPTTVAVGVVTNPSNMPIPVDVAFGCVVPSGLTGTTCSLNPAKITAGSPSGSSTILTINTIRGTTTSNLLPSGPGARLPWYLPWASAATLFALVGLLCFARNSTSRRLLPYYLAGVLLAVTAAGLAGCGGAATGTSAGTSVGSTSVAGTPMGPSSVTVTSTAAGIMKTVSIPINVN
jgi:uncharacterized repeat protein (TIGR01451 family)